MNKISHNASVNKLVDIEVSSLGSVVEIGENCFIDSFVKFKFAGGLGNIVLNQNVHVNSGCVFYSGHGIYVGSNTLIAANCTFAATNHEFSSKEKLILEQGFRASKGGITIEEDCWIGSNCVLLDGASVGRGSVVAAGSVIRGRVEPYSICAINEKNTIGHRK